MNAESFGMNPIEMVSGFGCLKGVEDKEEAIARGLYGRMTGDEDDNVANALAWFAAEEVARAFCDE